MTGLKAKAKNKKLLDESYLEPQNHKVRITTFLDGDILEELKKRAGKQGTKYQTLLNRLLRESLWPSEKEELTHRLEKLERVVFKKNAV
ncbi:MAG: BrnA antitoxin family protein [Bdellovibrionaceae bacterium]|nr:BrnA antitoxin family protein [Pseudobdellovibrionaceae bacterium]